MSASYNTELEYPPPPFKKPRIHSPTTTFPPISEAQICNYKTQLCRRFRLGICTQGSRCSYAHSVGELRRRREIGGGGGDSTRVCRMFAQGRQCSYGNTCRFPHIRHEGAGVNSRERSIVVEVIPTIRNSESESESDRLEFKNVLISEGFDAAQVNRKTELKRFCSSGKICRFAHGQAELLGKPEGCLTSECGVMQTSSTATTDASIRVVQTGSLLKKESHSLNLKFKRNELHRISRIYADWI